VLLFAALCLLPAFAGRSHHQDLSLRIAVDAALMTMKLDGTLKDILDDPTTSTETNDCATDLRFAYPPRKCGTHLDRILKRGKVVIGDNLEPYVELDEAEKEIWRRIGAHYGVEVEVEFYRVSVFGPQSVNLFNAFDTGAFDMTSAIFATAFFVRDHPRVHQYEAGCAWTNYVSAITVRTDSGFSNTANYISGCTICIIGTTGGGDQQSLDGYFQERGVTTQLFNTADEMAAAFIAGDIDAISYDGVEYDFEFNVIQVPELGGVLTGPFFRRE